jgi:hypothetical protein
MLADLLFQANDITHQMFHCHGSCGDFVIHLGLQSTNVQLSPASLAPVHVQVKSRDNHHASLQAINMVIFEH